MDICKATVRHVIKEDSGGPCAVAISDRLGVVEFTLGPDVWEEKEWPTKGAVILVAKLRREDDGWRAKEARLWTERDEQTINKEVRR